MSEAALIVQSDGTLLLDMHADSNEEARAAIAPFAELEKSPEHMHTYRMSPLSLWNAASAGYSGEVIIRALTQHSRYAVPDSVTVNIHETLRNRNKIRVHIQHNIRAQFYMREV